MIPRYTRPEMAAIWSDEARFSIWLEIECLAAEAMAEYGEIPQSAARAIREKGDFDIARIAQIEAEVRHDVIAFLTNVGEHVGADARWLHQGMTSSDVIDTGLSVQLTRAADLLLAGMDRLLEALKARALEHKHTVCVGRSHAVHAEPTTFGLKLLSHYAAFQRGRDRLARAREEVAVAALSGAVGTYAELDPRVEAHVAARLGLRPEPVSTQIIPRDRHAMFFATLGVIASSIENLATEIRHLQRSELREAEEFFHAGQKGSSAMPHKRNPILSENLTGLARLVRGAVTPALEDVTLWHERDISHSSVERVIAPDATGVLDFALDRMAGVVEKLVVHPGAMMENLNALGGLIFSQRVLLALTRAGLSREAAYEAVQRCAMAVWDSRGRQSFRALLAAEPDIARHLDEAALDTLFDPAWHLRHVDQIFTRLLDAQ